MDRGVGDRLKIFLVASEVAPFAKTGGLADVAGALPRALAHLGHEVRLFMPKYRGVERHTALVRVPGRIAVPLGERQVEGALWEGRLGESVPIYFLEHDGYYHRDALYGTPQGDYLDNAERFVFFCRAAMETLQGLGWRPDVIHAHDWQTGLLPVYLETLYRDDPFFSSVASVFTIHNLAYQGLFWHYDLPMTGLGWDLFTPAGIEFWGKINFLKGGVVFADLLSTVSKTYAREIQTEEFGCGLEGVLQERSQDLFGIVNGIDYRVWNPATDVALPTPYRREDPAGKRACKTALQKEMGLTASSGLLVGMVSRLADQKGFDLLAEALPALMGRDLQLVILGTGEERYHRLLGEMAQIYPGQLAVRVGFDDGLARQIYGGADLFLMPSRYEPCGLGQLISLRYGTIPAVRKTGGLADTVEEFQPASGTGTGFVFEAYVPEALVAAVDRAIGLFRQEAQWQRLVQNAMAADFSWEASARRYVDLFDRAVGRARHWETGGVNEKG